MQESLQHILKHKMSFSLLLYPWVLSQSLDLQGINPNPRTPRCSKILQEDKDTLPSSEREREQVQVKTLERQRKCALFSRAHLYTRVNKNEHYDE